MAICCRQSGCKQLQTTVWRETEAFISQSSSALCALLSSPSLSLSLSLCLSFNCLALSVTFLLLLLSFETLQLFLSFDTVHGLSEGLKLTAHIFTHFLMFLNLLRLTITFFHIHHT